MGAGVAFLDYDQDGDQDLFFVNSSAWPNHEVKPAPTQKLYRNDGKGHFEDVTKAAGLDKTFYGQGVAVGDYDDDGDPDLYVTAIGGGHLFRNDGKGHFEDVTELANARGVNGWLTGAAFLDIDNDGDLDLFIANYITWTPDIDKVQGFQLTGLGRAYGPPTSFGGSFCVLLRNDRGRFTDISESSGIQVRTPDLKVPVGKSLGVAPYDVNGDGLVNIAVANDTVQNFLFHNKGGGKFEEIAILSGVAFDQSGSPRGGMGVDWAPFLNDERLGLAVGNFANEMTASMSVTSRRRSSSPTWRICMASGRRRNHHSSLACSSSITTWTGGLTCSRPMATSSRKSRRSRPVSPMNSPCNCSGTRESPAGRFICR